MRYAGGQAAIRFVRVRRDLERAPQFRRWPRSSLPVAIYAWPMAVADLEQRVVEALGLLRGVDRLVGPLRVGGVVIHRHRGVGQSSEGQRKPRDPASARR